MATQVSCALPAVCECAIKHFCTIKRAGKLVQAPLVWYKDKLMPTKSGWNGGLRKEWGRQEGFGGEWATDGLWMGCK